MEAGATLLADITTALGMPLPDRELSAAADVAAAAAMELCPSRSSTRAAKTLLFRAADDGNGCSITSAPLGSAGALPSVATSSPARPLAAVEVGMQMTPDMTQGVHYF